MANNNGYTDEFRKSVVKEYWDGKKKSEIISKYGMAKQTLSDWINSMSPEILTELQMQVEQLQQVLKEKEAKIVALEKENQFLNETLITALGMKK